VKQEFDKLCVKYKEEYPDDYKQRLKVEIIMKKNKNELEIQTSNISLSYLVMFLGAMISLLVSVLTESILWRLLAVLISMIFILVAMFYSATRSNSIVEVQYQGKQFYELLEYMIDDEL
jgi:VIT1/CCC1 family predicted Fe2+/Mn2+ transporter